MLQSLTIENFVLIDRFMWSPHTNFSVITGETGAGKSIILGALELVLGKRADTKSIKPGSNKCVIEAHFDVSRYSLRAFFDEHELEYDHTICILRRELHSNGKSRAFVNDSPAPLAIIRQLGDRLIDIHSQHQNLLLNDPLFPLQIIDIMAQHAESKHRYQDTFKHYQHLRKELKQRQEQLQKSRAEEDYLRYQLEQLVDANLDHGEQERLEQEQQTLVHAEEIKGALYHAEALLSGDDSGTSILALMREATQRLQTIATYHPKADEMSERMHTAYIDMKDLASEIETDKEQIDFSPEHLNRVTERLDTLYTLQQKHRVGTIDQLITLRDSIDQQLQRIDTADETIHRLEQEIETLSSTLIAQATTISTQRKAAAEAFTDALSANVKPLGMPKARVEVRFQTKATPDVEGIDELTLLFAANKNAPLQPIATTASGGEISRLMLCIKAMIADRTALPSIIFDEVDTGVSGDIADRMGNIMSSLGKQMQVVSITHLPQIAAKGAAHYFVYKQDAAERTITRMRTLTNEERVEEIARMLSGSSLTDAARANAKELLRAASQ